MLSGTALLIAGLFIIALVVMSTIDAAFEHANKVSLRRLVDGPSGKAASSIAVLLDTRAEVVTSIHIIIQLLLVSGAVLLFTVLERLPIPYTASLVATVVVMMFVILVFRHLIPRILTLRNPEAVLLRLFPIFTAAQMKNRIRKRKRLRKKFRHSSMPGRKKGFSSRTKVK